MPGKRLPLRAHLGVFAQEFERQADQIVKVHALVSAQALFIASHDDGGLALVFIGGLGQGLFGIEPRAFPGANRPLPVTRGSRVSAATGVFQDTGHIRGIQNAELGFES